MQFHRILTLLACTAVLALALPVAEAGPQRKARAKAKPKTVHLCLTGHKRIKKLIDAADLVTEMRMIKHPYYKGVLAQRGIDF